GTYLRKRANHFADLRIDTRDDRARSVDAALMRVRLESGAECDYDKLLLATGSRPITPPIPGIDHPKVINCWTLADARRIADGIRPGAPVVLIGAGFIGCIILEALVHAGAELTVIEMGDRMVPRMLDPTCGALLQKWCEQKGVAVKVDSVVAAIDADDSNDGRLAVRIEGGAAVPAELVISAVGVRANADFLDGSDIELRDGAVLVDQYLAASARDVHAAGDVACGRDFSTGEYSVQAIQPTAVEHARVAAHNMHRPQSVAHQGAVAMNVLDTIGLISASYGLWQGVDGGDSSALLDEENFRYIRLRFEDDRLIGANTLGLTEHIGILRGLIQGRFGLGEWKARLMENPLQLMEAYLAATQSSGRG
ncbi:MAG: NAD(P)/FAD-dependent oxidoreductase, partial [bacterium]